MVTSKTAHQSPQVDAGSLQNSSRVVANPPAEPITPEKSLAKAPVPTLVGGGKTISFKFTETADEPSVHVTAEEAARLEDNSLLTCLKKQYRKTNDDREAFLVYYEETVRRFARPRLRDANGHFVSDGKPTLPEAFAAIGLSFEAEQKRSERYKKKLKELAELATPALTEEPESLQEFSNGEEVYFPGCENTTTYYVVGKDIKANTYDLISSDGKEEKKKVPPQQLTPAVRQPVHKLKEGDRYVDTATKREFVYDGMGRLKPVVLPPAVKQALDTLSQREIASSVTKAKRDVPTAEEKSAQKARRRKEAEQRDRKKIETLNAKRAEAKPKGSAASMSSTKMQPVKVARIGDTAEFGVFPESCTEYTTDTAQTIGTRDMCESERDRINEKRFGNCAQIGRAPDVGSVPTQL